MTQQPHQQHHHNQHRCTFAARRTVFYIFYSSARSYNRQQHTALTLSITISISQRQRDYRKRIINRRVYS